MAKRTDNLLTALTVGHDGALYDSEVYTGKMNREVRPIRISQPNFAPSGAGIALAKQTNNQLTALTVGNNGALYVSWVVGTGKWEGPVPISQPKIFAPRAGIAMTYFTGARALEALIVGPEKGLYVSWVAGTGKWYQWQGPVRIS